MGGGGEGGTKKGREQGEKKENERLGERDR